MKPEETVPAPATDSMQWGTWEELLLACAVNRYGAKNWDSVAVEIRKRTSSPITVTPHNCKTKYLELKRRYRSVTHSGDVSGSGDDYVPWLDELRKLRVAELKRELEHYDLSIVSLQMKLKRLTEERDNGQEKVDLRKFEDSDKIDEQKPVMLSTEPEGETAIKQESGGDNQLENDTNPVGVGAGDGNVEPETGSLVREGSCNGSSDSKPPVLKVLKVEPVGEVSEYAGEGNKENSDVQSSACKSRNEGSDKVDCGSRKSDEGERVDEQCVGVNEIEEAVGIESQPLVNIFQIVRSHKLGSVFDQQLLESQEKLRYKNMIRQHINLKMLQSMLEEGCYTDHNEKFFRDLLLFVNNVLVFFSKKSPESLAAIELRQIISKEMTKTSRNEPTDLSIEEQLPTPPVNSIPSKQAPEKPESLLLKSQIAGGSMIVCRKRSSIAAKASASGADMKKDQQKVTLAEEKLALNVKQPEKSLEEQRITKKRTKDVFTSGAKKNGKNAVGDSSTNKTSRVISSQSRTSRSPGEHSEIKTNKKKNTHIETDLKKQGAAKFLNRMKSSSSSDEDDDSENEIGEDQKKGGNKSNVKKDSVPIPVPVPRRSAAGREIKEIGNSSKKNVVQQPKRAAARPPARSGKRVREVGDDAETVASKQPRKRSRK